MKEQIFVVISFRILNWVCGRKQKIFLQASQNHCWKFLTFHQRSWPQLQKFHLIWLFISYFLVCRFHKIKKIAEHFQLATNLKIKSNWKLISNSTRRDSHERYIPSTLSIKSFKNTFNREICNISPETGKETRITVSQYNILNIVDWRVFLLVKKF